jgi:hypothetical protein
MNATRQLREAHADDRGRGTRLTADAARPCLDDSKHRVTDEKLRLLLRLAEERGPAQRIEATSSGRKIHDVAAVNDDPPARSTGAPMRRYLQSRNGGAR